MILFCHGTDTWTKCYEKLNESFSYWMAQEDPTWLIVRQGTPNFKINFYSLDYFLNGNGILVDKIVDEGGRRSTFEGDDKKLPLHDRKFLYIMSLIKNEEKKEIYMQMWRYLNFAKDNWKMENGRLTCNGEVLSTPYLNEFYLRNLYTMADFIECCSSLKERNDDISYFTSMQRFLNKDIIKIGIHWEYFNKLWQINEVYNNIKHTSKSFGNKVALVSIRAFFEEYIRKICKYSIKDRDVRYILDNDEDLFPSYTDKEMMMNKCNTLNRMLSSVQHCNVEVNERFYKTCYRYFCEILAEMADTNIPEEQISIYDYNQNIYDSQNTVNDDCAGIPYMPVFICIDTQMGINRTNELLDKYEDVKMKYWDSNCDYNIDIINVGIGYESKILNSYNDMLQSIKNGSESKNCLLEKTLRQVEKYDRRNRKPGDKPMQIIILSDGYFNDNTKNLTDRLLKMSENCYIEAIMIGQGSNPHIFRKVNKLANREAINIIE